MTVSATAKTPPLATTRRCPINRLVIYMSAWEGERLPASTLLPRSALSHLQAGSGYREMLALFETLPDLGTKWMGDMAPGWWASQASGPEACRVLGGMPEVLRETYQLGKYRPPGKPSPSYRCVREKWATDLAISKAQDDSFFQEKLAKSWQSLGIEKTDELIHLGPSHQRVPGLGVSGNGHRKQIIAIPFTLSFLQ